MIASDLIQWKKVKKKISEICDPIFNKMFIEKQKKENKSLKRYMKNEEKNNNKIPEGKV